MFLQSAKFFSKCAQIVPSRAEKRVKKKTKKSPKVSKKNPHVRETELKRPKKRQNGLKNETIRIVAGHSEQNEPLWVCLGREYQKKRYSLAFTTQKTKKNVKMDWKTNRFGMLRDIRETKTNRSVLKEHPTGMKKHYTMTSRNRMQKIETPNPHDSLFAGMW